MITHTHEDSADSPNTQAHNRYNGLIQTRNFRLSRTKGTDTKYTLMDRRTAAEIEFDYVTIGMSMGRGDTVQFYVGEPDLDEERPTLDLTRAADMYQHDLDNEVLRALRNIEKYGEFPEPDYVVDANTVKEVSA